MANCNHATKGKHMRTTAIMEINPTGYNQVIDQYSADLVIGRQTDIEKQLFAQLATDAQSYDSIDYVTDGVYFYEACLVEIAKGNIPTDNIYFQALVVRLAYNAITDIEEFAWIVANSRFTEKQIQEMIDLAASTVVWHKNFQIDTYLTVQAEQASYLQYLYCGCNCHQNKVLSR
jgi:hypothetical protein